MVSLRPGVAEGVSSPPLTLILSKPRVSADALPQPRGPASWS
jgi:hypothetical protein